jgi:hypothetical protein
MMGQRVVRNYARRKERAKEGDERKERAKNRRKEEVWF